MTAAPETAPRWIEDNVINDRAPLWTRANVGEVLPEPPSPLAWDLVWEEGTMQGWRDCAINRMGTPPEELDEQRPEVLGLFGGYGYLGVTFIRVFGERTPGMSAQAMDEAYFGEHPDAPPYAAEPWHQNEHATAVMTDWLGWVMTASEVPELLEHQAEAATARSSRPDLASLSDQELVAHARTFIPVIRKMFDWHINMSGAASIGPGALGQICAAVGRPEVAMELIAGLGGVDSAAPSYAMWKMSRVVREQPPLRAMFDDGPVGLTARLREATGPEAASFLEDLDDFLYEYGSRGPNEWDIHAPTWELEPDLVLAAIDRMRLAGDDAAPEANQAERAATRATLVEEIAGLLDGDPEAQGQFLAAAGSAGVFVPSRERTKTNVVRIINESRMAMHELGSRFVDRGIVVEPLDICLLFADEVEAAIEDPTGWSEVVVARQATYDRIGALEPPFIINETVPPVSGWAVAGSRGVERVSVGDNLQGVPGCPGVARGTARVVLDPSDPTVLGPGEILVAPHTDPAWTPLFVPAAAVVVDVGAALSHAIIVSRELGIPCAVSVTDATRRIPDGATIEVDGSTGAVTVIDLT